MAYYNPYMNPMQYNNPYMDRLNAMSTQGQMNALNLPRHFTISQPTSCAT